MEPRLGQRPFPMDGSLGNSKCVSDLPGSQSRVESQPHNVGHVPVMLLQAPYRLVECQNYFGIVIRGELGDIGDGGEVDFPAVAAPLESAALAGVLDEDALH